MMQKFGLGYRLACLGALLFAACSLKAQDSDKLLWMDDFAKAQASALVTQKPILTIFR